MKRRLEHDYVKEIFDIAYEWMNENDTVDEMIQDATSRFKLVEDVCDCVMEDVMMSEFGDDEARTRDAVLENLHHLDLGKSHIQWSLMHGRWSVLERSIKQAAMHDAVSYALYRYMEED